MSAIITALGLIFAVGNAVFLALLLFVFWPQIAAAIRRLSGQQEGK